MKSPNELLKELNYLGKQYERMNNKYREFVAEILEVKKIDDRFDAITLEVTSDSEFGIRFLDRELLVKFSFFVDHNDNIKGCITCFLVINIPAINYKPINSFDFDGQGNADIPSSNTGGPYAINNRADAVNILADWLRTSLSEGLM